MTKNSLSNKVLNKIKENNIQQKPKWTFLLKDYLVWGLGAFCLLVGSLAFSVMIYLMKNNGWEEYSYITDSFWQFAVLTLPYFWIFILILFIFVADYNLRHTKKGYRYRLPIVVFGSIFVSLIFGIFFYNIGAGKAIDEVLGKNETIYSNFINPGFKMWHKPERGVWLGRVSSSSSESVFQLQGLAGEVWTVGYQPKKLAPIIEIKEGQDLKVFGELKNDREIEADFIRPVGPGRGMMKEKIRRLHHPSFKGTSAEGFMGICPGQAGNPEKPDCPLKNYSE